MIGADTTEALSTPARPPVRVKGYNWDRIHVEPEPHLVRVADNLSLPAEWSAERRAEFLRRWQQENEPMRLATHHSSAT